MTFSIYLPPQAERALVPVLYWLSGLTCTDENFVAKAGAQQHAAEHGIAVVAPDTSPRGEGVADDPDGAYDLGLGAGFYVNATQAPWSQHYRMYDYVVTELPAVIGREFAVDTNRTGLFGHSMGGHGALTIALKNPGVYQSVSAFSPICSPIRCPWGQKALLNYLGDNQHEWYPHDAVELVRVARQSLPILIDQGDADEFLADQLNTSLLLSVSHEVNYPVEIRYQQGYDHSYFFIASFMADHIRFHQRHLQPGKT